VFSLRMHDVHAPPAPAVVKPMKVPTKWKGEMSMFGFGNLLSNKKRSRRKEEKGGKRRCRFSTPGKWSYIFSFYLIQNNSKEKA